MNNIAAKVEGDCVIDRKRPVKRYSDGMSIIKGISIVILLISSLWATGQEMRLPAEESLAKESPILLLAKDHGISVTEQEVQKYDAFIAAVEGVSGMAYDQLVTRLTADMYMLEVTPVPANEEMIRNE